MTVGISGANFGNVILNLLRGTNATAPTSVTVKPHIGDPGASGTSNPAAGSTTRVAITWAAPSGVQIAMNGTPPAWTNSGATETLSHISFWDQSLNFLGSGVLASTQPWVNGNVYTLNAQTVAVTPVAA